MSIQKKIIRDMMNKYIQKKSEIKLSDIISIQRDIENTNKDEKFFFFFEKKYKLIISKINKLQKENEEMQEVLLQILQLLNVLVK